MCKLGVQFLLSPTQYESTRFRFIMDPSVLFVTNQFKREGFGASAQWIKACIDWIKEEDPSSVRTSETLLRAVRNQYFDTDLRESGIQSGPQLRISDLHPDKSKAPNPIKGTFCLQLQRYARVLWAGLGMGYSTKS